MTDILRELAVAKAVFQLRAIEAVIRGAASGTEAGTGETEGLDPKGDGPTLEEGDAQ